MGIDGFLEFYNCEFSDSRFVPEYENGNEGTILHKLCCFTECNLGTILFINCDIKYVIFMKSIIYEIILRNSNIKNIIFQYMSIANFNIKECGFNELNLYFTYIQNITLHNDIVIGSGSKITTESNKSKLKLLMSNNKYFPKNSIKYISHHEYLTYIVCNKIADLFRDNHFLLGIVIITIIVRDMKLVRQKDLKN
jgi:hypothetical protein